MRKLSFTAGVTAIALALTAILPAAGVFANTVASADYQGNPITLRRTVTNVTNPVTNTFGYTITNTSTPTGGTVSGAPSSASIAFSNASPATGTTSVENTATVDFSAANYSKVGDYEFTITESSSSDASNYPIDTADNSYKAIVQVRYYVNPSTNVPDNTRYTARVIINNKGGTKVTEATWISGSSYTYIQATATTTGNMAETSDCFAYEISIPNSGVTAGGSYVIDINPTSGACSGSASSVTAGTPATVYLKQGDTVRVGYNGGALQLPVGASYTITDTNGSDGYTTKMDGTTQDNVTKTTVATTDANFNTSNTTAIENNKNTDPLTGIVTNFWFYIMLAIAGFVGFFIISRRKRDDEEEQQA